jgi:transcription elongation GreA/GreB family factor
MWIEGVRFRNADQSFEDNWQIVSSWSEESRYDRSIDQPLAERMLGAVSEPQPGVLQCIRRYW